MEQGTSGGATVRATVAAGAGHLVAFNVLIGRGAGMAR